MLIRELNYSNTNTYLIEGEKGRLLFDTGWAGTLPAFCRCMGELGIPVQEIDHILISHFHPDHCGIAQDIADMGAVIAVPDVQRDHIHDADSIFFKEKSTVFKPIEDNKVRFIDLTNTGDFLREMGIDGEIIYTPGHSDDSISLCLDDGSIFVGDLNPLYELELHEGTQIEDSWTRLLGRNPKKIYYGHAKAADFKMTDYLSESDDDLYALVSKIMKYTDKGLPFDKIQKKTGADMTFIEDVSRMYLTHQNVGVQGILDRIEIKNR